MRAGRLRHRVTVRRLTGDPPAAADVTTVWADVRPPAKDTGQERLSLRAAAPTPVIVRMTSAIQPGMYLINGSRLYHIDAANDKDARGRELWLSCTELQGETATYTPAVGAPYTVRAFPVYSAPYVGEFGVAPERRISVELPKIELATAWRRGDKLTLNGITYDLLNVAEGGDDGVVVRMLTNKR